MSTPRLPGGARYRDVRVGGCVNASVEQRADGSTLIRSTEALSGYPLRLTDCLTQWAQDAPDRSLVARRTRSAGADGAWQHISYAQMLARVQPARA